MQVRRSEAGFTLIELMISLALFGLIAVAGVALVDSVLGVQGRTSLRLDRAATLQRTMLLVGGDLDQLSEGTLAGGGGSISFSRHAPALGGPAVPVRYDVLNGTIVRSLGTGISQPVISGVSDVRWRFYDGAWIERWPPSPERSTDWPRAVEMVLQLSPADGPRGTLRRVVVLPGRP